MHWRSSGSYMMVQRTALSRLSLPGCGCSSGAGTAAGMGRAAFGGIRPMLRNIWGAGIWASLLCASSRAFCRMTSSACSSFVASSACEREHPSSGRTSTYSQGLSSQWCMQAKSSQPTASKSKGRTQIHDVA